MISGKIVLSASSLLTCCSASGLCSVLPQAHSYSCYLGQRWNLCSNPYSRMYRREQSSPYKFCGKRFGFEVFSKISVHCFMQWVYVEDVCFFGGALIAFFVGVGDVWVFWFLGEEFCLVGFACLVWGSLKKYIFNFFSLAVY